MNAFKVATTKKLFISLIVACLVIGVGIVSFVQYEKSVANSKLNSAADLSNASGSTLKVGTASSQQNISEQASNTENTDNAVVGNSSPQTRGATTAASKPYAAGVCTETPIPYKTVYETNPYLANGTQRVRQEGKDGYRSTCTPDSNGKQVLAGYTYPGYDKIIETGTYVAPPASTYQPPRNYTQCNQFSGTGAYQACIDAVNSQ